VYYTPLDQPIKPALGSTWEDLAVYTKELRSHIKTLEEDRAAINEYCG